MKPTKKTFVIIASVVCVSAVTLSIVVATSGSLPDVTKMSPEQMQEFVRSDKFRNLDPRQRRDYMRKVGEHRSTQQAIAFFSTEDDMKDVFLDDMIDEMQQRMKDFAQFRRTFDPNDVDSSLNGGFGGMPMGGRGGDMGRRGMGGRGGGQGRRRGDRQDQRQRPDDERQAERQQRSSPENQRLRKQTQDPAVRVMQKNLRRALGKRMSQRQ